MVRLVKRRAPLSGSLTSRFAADRSGVSAIEFAFILPLMLALYLGGIELGDAYSVKRKVTRVTSSLSDLVTQSKAISDADIAAITIGASSGAYDASPPTNTETAVRATLYGRTIRTSPIMALPKRACVTFPDPIRHLLYGKAICRVRFVADSVARVYHHYVLSPLQLERWDIVQTVQFRIVLKCFIKVFSFLI